MELPSLPSISSHTGIKEEIKNKNNNAEVTNEHNTPITIHLLCLWLSIHDLMTQKATKTARIGKYTVGL